MAAVETITKLETLESRLAAMAGCDEAASAAAKRRQLELTKPPGSLGRLEEVAIWLAAWQGRVRPSLDRVATLVFAANHGVVERGVSAYPAAVTRQMVANFEAGGAAINQLCQVAGSELTIVPIALETPTTDFCMAAAMSEAECLDAINRGIAAVPAELDLLALGEMGIGNTTAAAAMCAALFGGPAERWVGPGTGLDAGGVSHKATVIDTALRHHGTARGKPLEILMCLGGRELAALVGALIAARERGIPVLLDGFVVGAAAAVAHALEPTALDHAQVAHLSAEPGHARLLDRLGRRPLLQLDMRLGEGSGAALAILLCRAALACHNGMATFAEAAVSGPQEPSGSASITRS